MITPVQRPGGPGRPRQPPIEARARRRGRSARTGRAGFSRLGRDPGARRLVGLGGRGPGLRRRRCRTLGGSGRRLGGCPAGPAGQGGRRLHVVIDPFDDFGEGGPQPLALGLEMAGHGLHIAGELHSDPFEPGDFLPQPALGIGGDLGAHSTRRWPARSGRGPRPRPPTWRPGTRRRPWSRRRISGPTAGCAAGSRRPFPRPGRRLPPDAARPTPAGRCAPRPDGDVRWPGGAALAALQPRPRPSPGTRPRHPGGIP